MSVEASISSVTKCRASRGCSPKAPSMKTSPIAFALGFLLACGSSASNVGDTRCATDADCSSEQRCVLAKAIRIGTGDCLASSGANVCRPLCADCANATPCGCQCP